jgi:hypothetical protein
LERGDTNGKKKKKEKLIPLVKICSGPIFHLGIPTNYRKLLLLLLLFSSGTTCGAGLAQAV